MPIEIPPGLILIAAGLLLPLVPYLFRALLLLIAPLVTLWLVWQVPDGAVVTVDFLDLTWMFPKDANVDPKAFELILVQGDKLSRLFATVFAFMAFGGGLFSLTQKNVTELAAAFCYAGSAIGVVFAGDILTVFVFWEVMALGSTLVIWCGGHAASGTAGMRYVCIHLLGGVLLMAGVMDYIIATQSLAFGVGAIHEILGLDRPGTWLSSGRLPDQCRRAASLRLAAGCLPRGVVHGHGLSLRLHHQDRRLCAYPRLPRLRYSDLDRRLHDLLRHRLCAARERHAAHPGLLDRQPGRLHGHRHRHRRLQQSGIQCPGIERRGLPRLHAHYLQGTAPDVGGLGAADDGQAQVHRSWRPVSVHAADHGLRHYRRARNLVLPIHLGLRLEIHDLRQRRRAANGLCLFRADGGVCRRLPARRHQVPLVRLLPEGFRVATTGSALEYAPGDAAVRGGLHRPSVSGRSRSTPCCPTR